MGLRRVPGWLLQCRATCSCHAGVVHPCFAGSRPLLSRVRQLFKLLLYVGNWQCCSAGMDFRSFWRGLVLRRIEFSLPNTTCLQSPQLVRYHSDENLSSSLSSPPVKLVYKLVSLKGFPRLFNPVVWDEHHSLTSGLRHLKITFCVYVVAVAGNAAGLTKQFWLVCFQETFCY